MRTIFLFLMLLPICSKAAFSPEFKEGTNSNPVIELKHYRELLAGVNERCEATQDADETKYYTNIIVVATTQSYTWVDCCGRTRPLFTTTTYTTNYSGQVYPTAAVHMVRTKQYMVAPLEYSQNITSALPATDMTCKQTNTFYGIYTNSGNVLTGYYSVVFTLTCLPSVVVPTINFNIPATVSNELNNLGWDGSYVVDVDEAAFFQAIDTKLNALIPHYVDKTGDYTSSQLSRFRTKVVTTNDFGYVTTNDHTSPLMYTREKFMQSFGVGFAKDLTPSEHNYWIGAFMRQAAAPTASSREQVLVELFPSPAVIDVSGSENEGINGAYNYSRTFFQDESKIYEWANGENKLARTTLYEEWSINPDYETPWGFFDGDYYSHGFFVENATPMEPFANNYTSECYLAGSTTDTRKIYIQHLRETADQYSWSDPRPIAKMHNLDTNAPFAGSVSVTFQGLKYIYPAASFPWEYLNVFFFQTARTLGLTNGTETLTVTPPFSTTQQAWYRITNAFANGLYASNAPIISVAYTNHPLYGPQDWNAEWPEFIDRYVAITALVRTAKYQGSGFWRGLWLGDEYYGIIGDGQCAGEHPPVAWGQPPTISVSMGQITNNVLFSEIGFDDRYIIYDGYFMVGEWWDDYDGNIYGRGRERSYKTASPAVFTTPNVPIEKLQAYYSTFSVQGTEFEFGEIIENTAVYAGDEFSRENYDAVIHGSLYKMNASVNRYQSTDFYWAANTNEPSYDEEGRWGNCCDAPSWLPSCVRAECDPDPEDEWGVGYIVWGIEKIISHGTKVIVFIDWNFQYK
jgi:hypothetical protein